MRWKTKTFSLLLTGQGISLLGNSMLDLALSMYVLEVTGSAALFAAFLAAAMVPTILLAPLGGVLADRGNPKAMMVGLDLASGTLTLLATLLVGHGHDLPVLCATLILLSILGAFETPVAQACLPLLLQGESLVRGNAAVNQVSAVSSLAGPFLGSLAYSSLGLQPVLAVSGVCFLLTALLECFLQLPASPHPPAGNAGIWATIKVDLQGCIHLICQEQPMLLRLLLLISVLAFFVQGIALVGLPFLVRTVLGLSATHYGILESILAFTSIVGSILAGLLTNRLSTERLFLPLLLLGAVLFPVGFAFLLPLGAPGRYGVLLAASAILQIAATVFSVFALSLLQGMAPTAMLGKVMAFTVSFSLCAQPLGQILYGALFDTFPFQTAGIFFGSGLCILLLGGYSKGVFLQLSKARNKNL